MTIYPFSYSGGTTTAGPYNRMGTVHHVVFNKRVTVTSTSIGFMGKNNGNVTFTLYIYQLTGDSTLSNKVLVGSKTVTVNMGGAPAQTITFTNLNYTFEANTYYALCFTYPSGVSIYDTWGNIYNSLTSGTVTMSLGNHNMYYDSWNSGSIVTWGSSSNVTAFSITAQDPDTVPSAPSNLNPAGTSSSPQGVNTLTPNLSWTFSDTDAGDVQSAYQVQIYNQGGALVHDSQQVNSSDNFYVVPTSAALQQNSLYSWIVKTWDNYNPPNAGPYSANQYFKTANAPTVTNLSPGSTDSNSPVVTNESLRFSWKYSDLDGNTQTAYQVKIYNASTSQLVYDSQKVTSSQTSFDIPSGVLGADITFYWNVTVWDSTGMVSNPSNNMYIYTNTVPFPVTLVSPIDTARVTVRPVFLANIASDFEHDNQNFMIQLADDPACQINVKEYYSTTDRTGWEVNKGTGWVAIPVGGVDRSYDYKQVRYTLQSDLPEGKTYYWRMVPIDGNTNLIGSWSEIRSIRVGAILEFKLKNPISTTAAAKKIVVAGKWSLPTDGTTPASIKVEVCNNGLDPTPIWEDATAAFLSGLYYAFTNDVKTGSSWAIDCRVTVTANDSVGAIEFDGIGLSFS